MAAAGQIPCPPAGSYLAVSGQFLVAAVTPDRVTAGASPGYAAV